jgi:hypothetical protein
VGLKVRCILLVVFEKRLFADGTGGCKGAVRRVLAKWYQLSCSLVIWPFEENYN